MFGNRRFGTSRWGAIGITAVMGETAINNAASLAGDGDLLAAGEVTITSNSAITAAALAYITQSLGYTGTLAAGDVLVIDVDEQTVELNGVNVVKYFTGVFPLLYTESNELRWKDDDGSRDVELAVTHKPRWV